MLERADQLQPGPVPDVGKAGVAMSTKVTLQDEAVLGPVEEGTPVLQLVHPVWRFLGMQLGHPPVVHELPAPHSVAEVDSPVVLRIDVAQGGGDPAFGHHRVRLSQQRLANQSSARSLSVGLHGGPQASASCTDDDDVVLMCLVVGHQKSRRSVMTLLARRRT